MSLPAFSFTATHSLLQGSFVRGFAPEFDEVAVRPSGRPSRHSCRSRLFARGGGGVFTEIWKGTREQNSVQRSGELYCSNSSELQNYHESAPSFFHRSSLFPVKSLWVGIPPVLHTRLTLFTSLALFCSCRQILSLSLAVSSRTPLPQSLHGATP